MAVIKNEDYELDPPVGYHEKGTDPARHKTMMDRVKHLADANRVAKQNILKPGDKIIIVED